MQFDVYKFPYIYLSLSLSLSNLPTYVQKHTQNEIGLQRCAYKKFVCTVFVIKLDSLLYPWLQEKKESLLLNKICTENI